jgi:hypothetical protein
MTNSPDLVSESCHESTFKLIRHHNFNDVYSVSSGNIVEESFFDKYFAERLKVPTII